MLTHRDFSCVLLLDDTTQPLLHSLVQHEQNSSATVTATVLQSTKWTLAWRREGESKRNEAYIARVSFGGQGEVQCECKDYVGTSSVSGLFGVAGASTTVTIRLELSEKPSENEPNKEYKISASFDINVERVLNPPPGPSETSFTSCNPQLIYQSPPEEESPSPRVKGGAGRVRSRPNNPRSTGTTQSQSSGRHHPYSTPIATPTHYQFNRLEEQLAQATSHNLALATRLNHMAGQCTHYEATVEKLYDRLQSHQLVDYLTDRQRSDVLSGDMRLAIAVAKKTALEAIKVADTAIMSIEVTRILAQIRGNRSSRAAAAVVPATSGSAARLELVD